MEERQRGRNRAIAERCRAGERNCDLALEYGVSKQRISQIAKAEGVPSARVRGRRKTKSRQGYVLICVDDHPTGKDGGQIFEHVYLAARALGRALPTTAQVHHANQKRDDNRPGNLVLCEDAEYHALLHVRTRALMATGDPNKRKCNLCKHWDDRTQLQGYGRKSQYQHPRCRAAYQRRWRSKKRRAA